jgi:hypothetical protein
LSIVKGNSLSLFLVHVTRLAFARQLSIPLPPPPSPGQLLYNSSTMYDDLGWAAGWLYKATQQESYLADVYDFYMQHLSDEAPISDFK